MQSQETEEQQQLNIFGDQLDMERQYFDVIYQKYILVYYVDLYKDCAKVIKLDPHAHVWKMQGMRPGREFSYTPHIKSFAERFVKDNKQVFQKLLSCAYIETRLKKISRYAFRFDGFQNLAGNSHYEVQVMRANPDVFDGKAIVVSEEIDGVIVAEQQRQMELETERLYLDVLTQDFASVYHVDLNKGTSKMIKVDANRYQEMHAVLRRDYDYQERIETYCAKYVVPELQKDFCYAMKPKNILRQLKYASRYVYRYRTKQQYGQQYFEMNAFRMDDDPESKNILIAFRCIDAIVTAEEQHQIELKERLEIERQQKQLIADAKYAEAANKAKTDFISQVAHDIRNPMNSILGFLEIAQSNIGDWEKVKHSLEMMRISGEFLKGLVDDVLDISRMENGVIKICPETVCFTELMESFRISMQNYQFGKKQDFQFVLCDVLQDWIEVDPLRLKQIYENVLSNAVKYTSDGGAIEITVSQQALPDPKKIRIIANITDNGIGMSEEFMKKMFNKFERATDTRVNTVSGYGLGLSIVKQLVDLMSGTLEVKSRLGKGTSVCIALDVPCASEQPSQKQLPMEDYVAVCAGMHLLVAEDNELNREVITELLQMHGITCECAEDGEICLKYFQTASDDTYDAILMDMQMPNMNGLEATKAIRELPSEYARTIPIIAMTANALKKDIQECLEVGMDRHISKPIDMKKMLQALSETKRKRS